MNKWQPKISDEQLDQLIGRVDAIWNSSYDDSYKWHKTDALAREFAEALSRQRDELAAKDREMAALRGVLLMFRDEIVRATAVSTHYEGCEANHKNCAWLKRIDAAIAAKGEA